MKHRSQPSRSIRERELANTSSLCIFRGTLICFLHLRIPVQAAISQAIRNGSSLPPRLPGLSNVLKQLNNLDEDDAETRYTIVALSYRGYWTSRGSASQKGIEKDARATLNWVQETFANTAEDVKIILWGQSIGSGVATGAAADYLQESKSIQPLKIPINDIILETPFVSIRQMLAAMYPQKWVPYRYLWPFLWNWWDSEAALRRIAASEASKDLSILLLPAGQDEVVPAEQANDLEALCHQLGLRVERQDVANALHTEVVFKAQGRNYIAAFVSRVSSG